MNATKVTEIIKEVKDGDDFEVDGAKFRYYNNALWIDGGERDDLLIDSFDDEDGKATIILSKKHFEAYAKAVANGLYD